MRKQIYSSNKLKKNEIFKAKLNFYFNQRLLKSKIFSEKIKQNLNLSFLKTHKFLKNFVLKGNKTNSLFNELRIRLAKKKKNN